MQQHQRLLITIAIVGFAAACGKSAPAPSCHDRVAAMATHLASPRPAAAGTTNEQIVKQIVPALAQCKPAQEVFAGVANLDGGADKGAYLRDKVPPAIEACNCAADPDTVGPLLENLLAAWAR